MLFIPRTPGSGGRILKRLLGAARGRASALFFSACVLIRYGRLGWYVVKARRIFTCRQPHETLALARHCFSLPDDAAIVVVGAFLGYTAIALAGARKIRGSGKVHCVDAFDVTVEPLGAALLQPVLERQSLPHRRQFESNIQRAGVGDWTIVHPGLAHQVAMTWNTKIDFLFIDIDARYEAVAPVLHLFAAHLGCGGIVALADSYPAEEELSRLVEERFRSPDYALLEVVGTITFAQRQTCRRSQ